MSNHTPGPWRVLKDTKYGPWNTAENKQGNPWYYQWWIDSPTRKAMALLEVPYLSNTSDHLQKVVTEHQHTLAEVAANAALIAAAPDLLAALEALTDRVEAWHHGVAEGVELIGLAHAAKEAIAKAKGTP